MLLQQFDFGCSIRLTVTLLLFGFGHFVLLESRYLDSTGDGASKRMHWVTALRHTDDRWLSQLKDFRFNAILAPRSSLSVRADLRKKG